MRKLTFPVMLLLLADLLAGCSGKNPSAAANTVAFSEVTEYSVTAESILEETISDTELPTECTEPSPALLDAEPGSFVLRYYDEKIQDYMDYCLFIPQNATENMPLIIFLHGDGEVGKVDKLLSFGIWSQVEELYGDQYPFIGLSPCSRVCSWIDDNVKSITLDLIEYIAAAYKIDRSRIILSGHSRGAIGTWHMLSYHGELFAAAVPVSCGPDGAVDYEKMAAVPVLAIAGTVGDDENIYNSSMRKSVQKLQEFGGKAEFMEIEGIKHGQTSSAAFTSEVFDWMLSCRKEDEK